MEHSARLPSGSAPLHLPSDGFLCRRFDPQGHLNNFRVIAPTATFTLKAPKADSVLVIGDWDNWQVRPAGGLVVG
eukprot:XP_001695460.1 predicted protein [Chlamydomonas reinhardtii]